MNPRETLSHFLDTLDRGGLETPRSPIGDAQAYFLTADLQVTTTERDCKIAATIPLPGRSSPSIYGIGKTFEIALDNFEKSRRTIRPLPIVPDVIFRESYVNEDDNVVTAKITYKAGETTFTSIAQGATREQAEDIADNHAELYCLINPNTFQQ